MDDHRHGTHVAGTIGAVGNNGIGVTGVAWQTTLLPVKFLDENNAGSTDDAVAAINYLVMLKTTGKANVGWSITAGGRRSTSNRSTMRYREPMRPISYLCAPLAMATRWGTGSISISESELLSCHVGFT